MAIVLSKEEILQRLSSAKATASASTQTNLSNFGDTLLSFLNSPVGQELVRRLLDRWLPVKESTTMQVSQTAQSNSINPEKLYLVLYGFLNSVATSKPDTTIKELKEEFEKNKDEILRLLENVAKTF